MLIIGCDFHPSGQQVFCMERETGAIVVEQWIEHRGDGLDRFYGSLPAGSEVGVEASGNMLWFERKLAEHGHRLRLGDPTKIRAKETRKQKHDRRDAEHIAQLMMKGDFPELEWVPSLEERDQRQLLMHRHKLVRMRAQIKNQLQHVALNQGLQKKRQLWSGAGREMLAGLKLEAWTRRRRDDLLQLLEVFDGYCAGLDEAVETLAREHPEARCAPPPHGPSSKAGEGGEFAFDNHGAVPGRIDGWMDQLVPSRVMASKRRASRF